MWICLNDAFVSVVASDKPNELKIRARKKEHLRKLFPLAEILTTDRTDYRFRVFVTKELFTKVLINRLEKIDYGNFKNSVKEDALHDLYLDFWMLHRAYQSAPPKSKKSLHF